MNLRVSKEEAAAVRLLAERLVSCPSQRVLSRAVYDEEYGESLRQCMEGEGRQAGRQTLRVWRDVTVKAPAQGRSVATAW